MNELAITAPAFVEMAHKIVWCTVATVDAKGRPRSRVLHPIWRWDGDRLEGWVATGPTPTKRAHLDASPFVSCNYWSPIWICRGIRRESSTPFHWPMTGFV